MDSHGQNQIVQVLQSSGWLTRLTGDGVNDSAYAQEVERRYRWGSAATWLRQDVIFRAGRERSRQYGH